MTELLLFTFSVSQSDSYFPILILFSTIHKSLYLGYHASPGHKRSKDIKTLGKLALSPWPGCFIITVDRFILKWLAYKSSVAGEKSNFGAVAGEAVLTTVTYVLYFVEIPILVCILYYIIQLSGCQGIFITVNYSQVIS